MWPQNGPRCPQEEETPLRVPSPSCSRAARRCAEATASAASVLLKATAGDDDDDAAAAAASSAGTDTERTVTQFSQVLH